MDGGEQQTDALSLSLVLSLHSTAHAARTLCGRGVFDRPRWSLDPSSLSLSPSLPLFLARSCRRRLFAQRVSFRATPGRSRGPREEAAVADDARREDPHAARLARALRSVGRPVSPRLDVRPPLLLRLHRRGLLHVPPPSLSRLRLARQQSSPPLASPACRRPRCFSPPFHAVGNVPAIERLGIPALKLNDGPQGFRDNAHPGTSTSWPSGLTYVALAAPRFKWRAAACKQASPSPPHPPAHSLASQQRGMSTSCLPGALPWVRLGAGGAALPKPGLPLSHARSRSPSRPLSPCPKGEEFYGKGANVQLGPGGTCPSRARLCLSLIRGSPHLTRAPLL